jgi:hypothetical protein
MATNQKVRAEYYLACADKIIAAMKTRQMECIYFENRKDMLEYLKAVIPAKATAAWGGSMTLKDSGVIDLLRGGLCKIIDRDAAKTPEEAHKCMHQAFNADCYFLSANAITMDGKLVNIDGNGNRVAALIYGPKDVYVIAGMNKVVKDEDAAMDRIKNMAAPMNAMRRTTGAPCTKTGNCMHCKGSGTICCHTVVTRYSRHPGRIKVLLVGEELGY